MMLAQLFEEIPVLSVTELSQVLKKTVEGSFAHVKLRGEISGLKVHTSGHQYLTLKDQESIIDAVAWRGTSLSILLQDGLEVIATGRITTYPMRSKYQMVITQVESAGEGALLKFLQDLKNRLNREGLFDRKRLLPTFPSVIGVITSPTGAVIKDIIHRISDRYPCCQVIVYPVIVQGVGAAEQIANAIQNFNKFLSKPDVLIVARGGGSLEDLWAFNEEIVVRAAYSSDIPIVSAVGHETDTTLIDFASDLRAPTPTAAAEMITPNMGSLLQFLIDIHKRLVVFWDNEYRHLNLSIANLAAKIPNLPNLLNDKEQKLDDWSDRFESAISLYWQQKVQQIQQQKVLFPSHLIQMAQTKLDFLNGNLMKAFNDYSQKVEQKLHIQTTILEQNSYQRTLEKGFCIIEGTEGIIDSRVKFLQSSKQNLSIHFADGDMLLEQVIPA